MIGSKKLTELDEEFYIEICKTRGYKNVIERNKAILSFLYFKKEKKYVHISVKGLCCLMDYFKTNFKTNKGNLSINKAKEFKEQYFNDFYIYSFMNQLTEFYNAYSKRKKEDKTFNKLINRLFVSLQKSSDKEYSFWDDSSQIELKKDSNINDFLADLKTIKKKYLKGKDSTFLSIISKINTGYTKSTLRKYYYDSDY